MEYAAGFVIALFIAHTGVGAGTITVPLLVLFLHVPAPVAVAVGLMFSAAIKLVLIPAQIVRRQVNWRTLGFMLLGGTPGVLAGLAAVEPHGRRASSQTIDQCAARCRPGMHSHVANCLFVSQGHSQGARSRSQYAAAVVDAARWRGGGLLIRRSGRSGQRRAPRPYIAHACTGRGHRYCFRLPDVPYRQRRALVSRMRQIRSS